METGYTLGYLLLVGGGGLIALYLYKSDFKEGGRLLAISSLALGIFASAVTVLGLEAIAYRPIGLTFGLSLFGVLYVEFRKPRALIILAIPFYVMVLTLILSLPLLILFATMTFEIGVLSSYQFSVFGASALSKLDVNEKGLRRLLVPFSSLGFLAERVFRGQPPRTLLFVLCSLFPGTIVTIGLLLWVFAGATTAAYIFLVAAGAYFIVTSNRLANTKV